MLEAIDANHAPIKRFQITRSLLKFIERLNNLLFNEMMVYSELETVLAPDVADRANNAEFSIDAFMVELTGYYHQIKAYSLTIEQ